MPEVKLPPIGFCIYCDADGSSVGLTDEHAIPFGLNGWLLLRKASCKSCAKITGTIEQRSLRGFLLEARTHLNMQTRRPKERPTTFRAFLKSPDGQAVETHLPISKNPMVLRLPNLGNPPILSGHTGGAWIEHISPIFWTFIGANTPAQVEAAKNLDSKILDYAPTQFALFLAKVAHCCAVFHKGYKGFEPLLAKKIISQSLDISDYVGGCARPLIQERNTSFHVNVRTKQDWVIVELCLFAHLGAPYYEVVVGRPKAP